MIDLIHNIAIAQGVVTGFVLLILKRNGKRDSKYIALFLLFLSLAITNESYGDYIEIEFHLLYPFKFFLLLPNLILLHINSKIIGTANSCKKVILNFLPGILEFGTLCFILLLTKLSIIDSNSNFLNYFDEVYNYLTINYTIFIQIIILKKIVLYNRNLYAFQSTIHYKYLNWLKWVCIIIIVNEIYYTLFYLLSNSPDTDNQSYVIYAIIELALIFYIGIGALLQVNLEIEIPLHDLSYQKPNKIDTDNSEVTNNHEMDSVFVKIESFMKTEHPFLNPNLNLKVLSQAMNIPERQISNAINQNSEQNFYSYINQYRVEAVKNMLANNEQTKYSIVGIGEAAGFNSKSSFYTNFKKVTDITPSQYIKEMS
ncbi:helix-turn-helix domain-containing protein [Aquimarina macrocephali]|uniref:helix-turn-helix domain-containing protein n=1 Tax=Aquimarina macrocephali TaxID=666563 RepID=UPI000462F05E|nr:helix-turn-helix domain-containing protein [Aquimarina macrocephali]